MSIWTAEEVKSLEDRNGGGNRAAEDVWFAHARREDRPRAGDHLDRFKEFVKRAYIDERWKADDRDDRPRRRTKDDSPPPSSRSGRESQGRRRQERETAQADRGSAVDFFDPNGGSTGSHRSTTSVKVNRGAPDDLFDPNAGSTGSRSSAAPSTGNRGSADDLFDPNASAGSRSTANPSLTDDFFDPNFGGTSASRSSASGNAGACDLGFDPNAGASASFGSTAQPSNFFDPFASTPQPATSQQLPTGFDMFPGGAGGPPQTGGFDGFDPFTSGGSSAGPSVGQGFPVSAPAPAVAAPAAQSTLGMPTYPVGTVGQMQMGAAASNAAAVFGSSAANFGSPMHPGAAGRGAPGAWPGGYAAMNMNMPGGAFPMQMQPHLQPQMHPSMHPQMQQQMHPQMLPNAQPQMQPQMQQQMQSQPPRLEDLQQNLLQLYSK